MKRLITLAIALLVAFASCSTQKPATKEKEPMSTEEWVKLRMETLESEGWTFLETTEPPQEILAQHYGRILEGHSELLSKPQKCMIVAVGKQMARNNVFASYVGEEKRGFRDALTNLGDDYVAEHLDEIVNSYGEFIGSGINYIQNGYCIVREEKEGDTGKVLSEVRVCSLVDNAKATEARRLAVEKLIQKYEPLQACSKKLYGYVTPDSKPAKKRRCDSATKSEKKQVKVSKKISKYETMTKKGDEYYDVKNYEEALKCYRKAAEKGYAEAQNSLGYMYEKGHGANQDYAEAVKWYRMAAEQGNAKGQINLGYMYDEGLGVNQDYAEAVKWYRKAAEQGHATGQYNLGIMCFKGQGVEENYAEAAKWFRKAAEQGDSKAQNATGIMYEYGYGVKKNIEEAKKWYQMAADQGYENAKEALKRLK